jgi:hypothetical protein
MSQSAKLALGASSKDRFAIVGAAIAAALVASCGSPTLESDPAGDSQEVTLRSSSLTAQDRLNTCAQDPRVVTGLVTKEICAGADIFLRETFNGNGRTCGTCHPMGNNTTIDPPFVAALRATKPNDPLFVAETNPALAGLEISSALDQSGILENVDGFEDPTHKFVIRAVPHVLSMKTSIAADTGDTTTTPPIERTGWGGDGAPGDGSLRSFLTGAVTQHYTRDLARRPGVDFRVPTSQELDLVLAFQLALGRLNELDLTQVNLFDSHANNGRLAFMDPQRGRCNVCHANAGANSQDTGKNRNFDTGARRTVSFGIVPTFDGKPLFDGGFGGQGLAHPNIVALPAGDAIGNDGFGTDTFNTPPLIEAADTGPFFHNNPQGPSADIEDAVIFYLALFQGSGADADLQARFHTPLLFDEPTDGQDMARFLRALNTALNLDMAKQRLRAALTLFDRFRDTRKDIQIGLMNLAVNELDDALGDITSPRQTQPFYPVAVDRIGLAKQEIAAALVAPASSRGGRISNAVSRVENARDQIGANITFQLGQGNLMF